MKLKNNPAISSLLLITFLCMLAYLPFIPFLGFYSDDFFFSYVSHFYGIPGIMKSLIVDRPFNGYLLAFNYFFLDLKDNVFLWHIYIFLIRLIGGYTLFFLLKKLWPKKLSTVTIITLLFLIYPGFLQQSLPLGFENYITTLTLWTFSFAFTVFAIKNRNRFMYTFLTMISLILQINSFLQVEFFIGMELLRLLIIAYITNKEVSFTAIKKAYIYLAPYIASLAIFVVWRIFIFKSTREVTDIHWVAQNYYSNPLWILKIPFEVIYGFLHTVVFAFFIPIIINFVRLPIENSLIAIFFGLCCSALFYFFYGKIQEHEEYDNKFGKNLLLIGLISIVGALIPIIVSGRIVRVFLVYDRYTITSIIGVAFLLVGFLSFKFIYPLRKQAIVLLLFLSLTSHLMNGFYRTDNWNKQKDLWWQLYWRAPNIEKNAMLILDFPPVSENVLFKDVINKVKWYRFYWAEEQIWSSGNLFFNYDNQPINHFYGDFLEDKGIVEKIKNKTIENLENRNISYTRNFGNTIIVSTPSDTSCLWVLDKDRNELPSHANELLKSNITYSDPDKLVKTELPIIPPKEIFGSEPPHGWCYYFEKASLARQLKDWDKLSQMKEEALQKNLKPKDPKEWLPFKRDLR